MADGELQYLEGELSRTRAQCHQQGKRIRAQAMQTGADHSPYCGWNANRLTEIMFSINFKSPCALTRVSGMKRSTLKQILQGFH